MCRELQVMCESKKLWFVHIRLCLSSHTFHSAVALASLAHKHIFSMLSFTYGGNEADWGGLLLNNSLGCLGLQNMCLILFAAVLVFKKYTALESFLFFFFTKKSYRTQTVKSGSSWAETTVEQGPLSSLTEQFLACGTCSVWWKCYTPLSFPDLAGYNQNPASSVCFVLLESTWTHVHTYSAADRVHFRLFYC